MGWAVLACFALPLILGLNAERLRQRDKVASAGFRQVIVALVIVIAGLILIAGSVLAQFV